MKSNHILDGIENIITSYFKFPKGKGGKQLKRNNKSAWEEFNLREIQILNRNQESLALRIYNKLSENINDGETWSEENWRFEPQTLLTPGNTQAEKILEKLFALQAPKEWANQVPACSRHGYPETKKMSIDLVCRNNTNTYEFIELKVPSKTNNAFYASLEILIYGVFYLLRDSANDTTDKINGKNISLKVLAPTEYYSGTNSKDMDTNAMEILLNDDLKKFKQERTDIKVNFSFAFEEINHEIFTKNENKIVGKALLKLYKKSPEAIKQIIFARQRHNYNESIATRRS